MLSREREPCVLLHDSHHLDDCFGFLLPFVCPCLERRKLFDRSKIRRFFNPGTWLAHIQAEHRQLAPRGTLVMHT